MQTPRIQRKHKKTAELDTRIRLLIRMVPGLPVINPLLAALVEAIFIADGARNLIVPFDKLHTEPLRCVPGDMTVHDPHARIIRREGN